MDNQEFTPISKNRSWKTTSWIAFAFYFLIAFEFFYMVTPFAVYFYSVYNPALELFSSNPLLLWLNQTFLPHIVAETKSTLLNQLHPIGGGLFLAGILFFMIGASQVYYHKLWKKREVTGGLYRWVRHPQYTGLMIAGLGMLLLWPRFIVLIAYLSMLFVYFFLSKMEEKECLTKFGEAYSYYLDTTPMFLPWFRTRSRAKFEQTSIALTFGKVLLVYALVMMGGVLVAVQVKRFSLDQLYAIYEDDFCAISMTTLDDETIRKIVASALEGREFSTTSGNYPGENSKGIVYVVPANWEAAEIPMHVPAQAESHIHSTRSGKIARYRVVFTRAVIPDAFELQGKAILEYAKWINPVLEVIVDAETGIVLDALPPVDASLRNSVHLPLF